MGFIRDIIGIIKDIRSSENVADKYLNMSVDELRALSDDEIDEAIFSVLYANEDSEDIDKYNPVQLTAITIRCFNDEIENGGLCQFFVNSSGDYAPYVIDSLTAIGATDICERFRNFVTEHNIDLDDLSQFKCESIKEYDEKEKIIPLTTLMTTIMSTRMSTTCS